MNTSPIDLPRPRRVTPVTRAASLPTMMVALALTLACGGHDVTISMNVSGPSETDSGSPPTDATTEETGIDSTASSTGGASETTGSLPTCAPGGGDCENPTPICGIEGMCRICKSDPECSDEHPETPACNNGSCVQCTPNNTTACQVLTPICNAGFTCEACTSDEQCQALQGTHCNISTGACFSADPNTIISVRPDPGPDDETTIGAALARLAELETGPEGGTIILYPGANDTTYQESDLVIAGDLDLQAAEATSPVIQGSNGPSLRLTSGAYLRLEGVQVSVNLSGGGIVVQDGASLDAKRIAVSNNAGVGIEVTSAHATLSESTVSSNDGIGIQAVGSTVDIAQSHIVNNSGGGIVISDDTILRLVNAFVHAPLDTSAISVTFSDIHILYSTLGGTSLTNIPTLQCDVESNVTLRNSIVALRNASPALSCAIVPETSVIVDETSDPALDTAWFGGNTTYNVGEFYIDPDTDHPFGDVARWSIDDPTLDIDGEPRFTAPPVDNTPDIAGADIPTPANLQTFSPQSTSSPIDSQAE